MSSRVVVSGVPTSSSASPRRLRTPPAWAVVLAACAGQFLVVLDVSVVNVALPSMRADLGLSVTGLQWVVNAYSIAFAGFMLLGGRAGDLFGHKRMFLVGLGLFTLASLAGGLAQAEWQLLLGRAVQGLGAAVLAPSTLTLLLAAVPEGPARGRAIATWSAVGAGGGAAGGLVGGVLTDGLSWRWVLLINVPIGILVLVAAALWLRESGPRDRRRLDLPGAVLVTGGLAVLAYGIVQTEAAGWTEGSTLVPLGGGLLLLALFVLVESRTRAPLMPLGLLRARSVWSANTGMLLAGGAMMSMWFLMTLYVQNVLGYTPLEAGLALIPSSLSVVLGSKAAPWAMRRIGLRATVLLGTALASAGFLWQSAMSAHGSYAGDVLGPGILMMLGAGVSGTPLATLATTGAAPGDAGLVSGLINTSRTMGGALGLAVLSTVAASRTAGGTDPVALNSGYALAFRVSGCVLAGAVLLMLITLPKTQAQAPHPAAEAEPAAPEDTAAPGA